MADPTAPERHDPPTENPCGTERDYGSRIIHVCEWTAGRCSDTHSCGCGLVWTATAPVTADDLRDLQREAAREAFADRTDAEGALSISTQRNPWEALDDALTASWAVRDEELKLLRAKVTAHDFAVDAEVARLGKRVDRADAELARLRARLAEEVAVSGLLARRAEASEGEHGVTREREAELRRKLAEAEAEILAARNRVAGLEANGAELQQRAERAEAAEKCVRALRDDWYRRPGWSEPADALDAALDTPDISGERPQGLISPTGGDGDGRNPVTLGASEGQGVQGAQEGSQ
jgi:hypothetical protein